MSDVTIEHVKPKQREREISQFLCNEMLYEHVEGRLDKSSSAVVENFLIHSEDFQKEYQHILSGLEFCEIISDTKVEDSAVELVQKRWVTVEKVLGPVHWSNWPDFTKNFLQAAVVAVTTAFIAMMLPWEKLPMLTESDRTIELVAFDRTSEVDDSAEETVQVAEEKKAESSAPVEAVASAPKPAPAEPVVQEKKPVQAVEKKEPVETAANASAATPAKPVVEEGKKASHLRGELYRVYMDMDAETLDKAASLISEKIRTLGGAKAGRVELGWKTKGGRYFHYKISEQGYDEVLEFLKSFGPIRRVRKDAHKLVMPEGQVRSILWIEGVGAKN